MFRPSQDASEAARYWFRARRRREAPPSFEAKEHHAQEPEAGPHDRRPRRRSYQWSCPRRPGRGRQRQSPAEAHVESTRRRDRRLGRPARVGDQNAERPDRLRCSARRLDRRHHRGVLRRSPRWRDRRWFRRLGRHGDGDGRGRDRRPDRWWLRRAPGRGDRRWFGWSARWRDRHRRGTDRRRFRWSARWRDGRWFGRSAQFGDRCAERCDRSSDGRWLRRPAGRLGRSAGHGDGDARRGDGREHGWFWRLACAGDRDPRWCDRGRLGRSAGHGDGDARRGDGREHGWFWRPACAGDRDPRWCDRRAARVDCSGGFSSGGVGAASRRRGRSSGPAFRFTLEPAWPPGAPLHPAEAPFRAIGRTLGR